MKPIVPDVYHKHSDPDPRMLVPSMYLAWKTVKQISRLETKSSENCETRLVSGNKVIR